MTFPSHYDHLVISTTSGQIHGTIDPALPNVQQYLGIPYALPPVGGLRWAPPQPLDQPNERVEATALPPSCMQYLTNTGSSLYVRDVFEFNLRGLNTTGAVSEDCLYLSVWAPTATGRGDDGWSASSAHHWTSSSSNTGKGALPVLIYIYGGGFSTGGMDVPYQIPAKWVNRSPDHIVVTFNYRLNIFGYPNAAGVSGSQNLGLLDQRAAIEWVQENIVLVVIQKAWSSGGLIMDSGTAYSPTSVKDLTRSNFTFVADHIGCSDLADHAPQQLACMRGASADTIEDFVAEYAENATLPGLSFIPVIDEDLVFSNYTERVLAGEQANIPAIIGTNTQDGVPFVPYAPDGPANQTMVLQALDTFFFCTSTESISRRQETNRLTYRYLYAGNFSNIAPKPWMGAYHSAELPLIMGTHPNFRGNSTALEYETSSAMQDAYTAFASDPAKGLQRLGWLPYTHLGASQVREFGNDVAVQNVNIADYEALCFGSRPVVPLPEVVGTCCDEPLLTAS
ncbi:hypothetical protein LTR17_026821 [Elasticomyces elasticus]|nr:hypothetical protein LTR17_026821 [Elasticomyces elasticus]